MTDSGSSTILFYDGDCAFCNKSVEFILKRTVPSRIKVAPLAGETAQKTLSDSIRSLDTLVLLQNGKVSVYSSAAIRAIALCGGLYKMIHACRLIPSFIRDPLYRTVARNRKRLIKRSCDIRQGNYSEFLLP